MKRIKGFRDFINEDLEVQLPPRVPYNNTVYKTPDKDVDLDKKDIEGSKITPKVPQFDLVKTLTIILTDGNLSARAAQIFPDTDLTKAIKNPEMLGPVEKDKLNQIYNNIILNDYVLRQKYDLLTESSNEIEIRKPSDKEKNDFVEFIDESGPPPDQADLADIVRMTKKDIIGAFKDGLMVGAISRKINNNRKDATEIPVLLVHFEYRKEGIGRKLVDYVIDHADTKYITTNPHTHEAEKFFEKIGFVMDEEFDEDDTNTMVKEKNSVLEDKNMCPECGEKYTSQCKCMTTKSKTLEDLKRGHGKKCPNGHVWSYDTPDGKAIILI